MIITNKFQSFVCPDGYSIHGDEIHANSTELKKSSLLPKNGLFFETLSALELIDENILNFVEQHGFLLQDPTDIRGQRPIELHTESLEEWQKYVKHLKETVLQFSRLKTREGRSELGENYLIMDFSEEENSDDEGKTQVENDDPWILTGRPIGNGYSKYDQVGSVTSGSFPVETALRQRIALVAKRYLFLHMKVDVFTPLQESTKPVSEHTDYLPFVTPANLLGVAWWQLINALSGNRQFTECEVCGKLIETTRSRKDVKTCSANCRVKKSRQRKYTHNTPTDGD